MLPIETNATKEETGNTQNIVKTLYTESANDINIYDPRSTYQTAEFTT